MGRKIDPLEALKRANETRAELKKRHPEYLEEKKSPETTPEVPQNQGELFKITRRMRTEAAGRAEADHKRLPDN